METGFETKGWCQLEGQDFVESDIVSSSASGLDGLFLQQSNKLVDNGK